MKANSTINSASGRWGGGGGGGGGEGGVLCEKAKRGAIIFKAQHIAYKRHGGAKQLFPFMKGNSTHSILYGPTNSLKPSGFTLPL